MDNRRKIIIIALIISTILVGVIAVALSQIIQNNQAPSDSGASGFGEGVNREYFDEFELKFTTVGCYGILSKNIVNAYANQGTTILKGYEMSVTNSDPLPKVPLTCTIKLDDSKSIDLSVHTYDQNSAIDPSAEALFARVNANILKVEYKGDLKTGYFFYGTDKADPSSCRMNFFNQRNDFEYITLNAKGFTESCKDQMLLAGEISYYLNKSVNSLIDNLLVELKK